MILDLNYEKTDPHLLSHWERIGVRALKAVAKLKGRQSELSMASLEPDWHAARDASKAML